MASAAVRLPHIVSSAQGLHGWAPWTGHLGQPLQISFFSLRCWITPLETGHSLLKAMLKGKTTSIFFCFKCLLSALVITAWVGILCVAIIASAFPNAPWLSITHNGSWSSSSWSGQCNFFWWLQVRWPCQWIMSTWQPLLRSSLLLLHPE